MQDVSNRISKSWRELEKELSELKKSHLEDKFQLAILNQKKKLYRKEFDAVINDFSIMIISLKSSNYKLV